MEANLQATGRERSETFNCLFECAIAVEKHFSQKNAKTIKWRGKFSATRSPFIASTDKSSKLSKHLLSAMQIRARELRIDKPISCPLQIMLTISVNNYYTQKGALNRRAGDLDNLIQGPIDCLMRAGIIEDDSQIVSIIADKVLGPNEIRIKLFMFK